ncbi:hypothetical protein AB0M31_40815 [Streptomyces sp. NPDC051773]|uniref:hypothetical protein n=1 Tax=Streptomyces sp. NPDC051773 TaxID=3156682 RepID=UPI00343E220C
MLGGLPRWVRLVGRGVLVAVIVAVPVVVHVQWVHAVDVVLRKLVRVEVVPDSPEPEEKPEADRTRAEAEKRYRAAGRPKRTGSTTLTIEESSDGSWKATADHDLTLRPGDPMIADLRRDEQDPDAWLPFELSIGSDDGTCQAATFRSATGDDRLRQAGTKKVAHATDSSAVGWQGDSCADDSYSVISVKMLDSLMGGDGMYDDWTVTVESKERAITALVGGTTLRQSPHGAELRLPAKGTVDIELEDVVSPSSDPEPTLKPGDQDAEILGAALQSRHSAWGEAFSLLAAVTAVTCCWAVPFVRRWAPSVTRGRWTVAVVVAGVLTWATLAYDLAADLGVVRWWAYAGRSVPLVVWWWTLLPLLLAAFAVRVTTGFPPRTRQLLPMALPSVLLFVPPAVLAVTGRLPTALVPVAAAAASAALAAYALRRGLLGRTGRRWAATAAVCTWWVVLAAGPGTGLPDGFSYQFAHHTTWAESGYWAASALAWGWFAVLCPVLAVGLRRSWIGVAVALTLWGALVLTATGGIHLWYQPRVGAPWVVLGIYSGVAASQPLVAVEVVVLCTALFLLRRYGRRQRHWPDHVRTAVLTLGITAAATVLALDGFQMFGADAEFRIGVYLAVTVAALGFAWLLPPSAEARAVRLHNTAQGAHNRRMHALLKDQTLAAGRREFLLSSRTALADGELTARRWSARWRDLGALGPRGTAPQHSLALRFAALGTSGGRGAWRNGIAAAVVLTALSVPWFVYTVPSRLSATYSVASAVTVWLHALRWTLYGFVYGYAYSWLRGRTPLGRAMCLLAVVLPAELAQLLYRLMTPEDLGIAALLTTGNCLAVFLVLGLYWEARLVRAAGLRWGQIRNFRSLSATAVPATTLLVAVSTALATAMVGVWVAPDTGPAPDKPPIQPSVSGTPTPGGN